MIKEQIGQQIGGLVTEESLSIKQREMKERLMREGWINREAMRNGEISTVEAKEEMTGVTEMRDVEEPMTDGVEVDGEEGGEEETLVEGLTEVDAGSGGTNMMRSRTIMKSTGREGMGVRSGVRREILTLRVCRLMTRCQVVWTAP